MIRRVYEHKSDFVESFTKKYGVHRLVYFEQYADVESAIRRENV
jgi:putative endonuclease